MIITQSVNHTWVKSLEKIGKSDKNIDRATSINQSAAYSVYILFGVILFLVLFGGIISIMFYWFKLKLKPRSELK